MTISNEQRLRKVHQEALLQFDRVNEVVRPERMQCVQDRRFYSIAGAQWEGAIGEQFEKRFKAEVNKVHLAVLRIINEYRNNRITVDFTSKDGSQNDQLADACDGRYRADEQDSGAEEAYDNAFEEGTSGGFGAWRLRAVYEDEEDPENEHQRIRIEPIFDADSCVFFDLDAKRQDKSDAKHCFVLTSLSRDAYKEEWGDDPTDWPKLINHAGFDWCTPDVVWISEYYRVEEVRDTVVVFVDPLGQEERHLQSELDADEELLPKLLATGRREVRRKATRKKKIHKYLMSGGKVLEDCGMIAGNRIPIVPMYGKRWFVDGIERCMGHVRLAKDAQRLKNMQLSKLGELSAISPIEKPIFTPEQMAGHQNMWSEDNLTPYPYLLVNPITGPDGAKTPSGPLGYTHPPQIPPAMAALLQITDQDMKEILGSPENAEQMVSNISGKVVELVQQRLDMQTFIYMSNMSKAVKCSGEIWLGMMRELAVEDGRKMKTLGSHGEVGSIELRKPVKNAETDAVELENDFTAADFDVNVEVGPSSTSRRQGTVRSLMNMMAITQDPETQQVLQSMIMMNMEGEGIGDAREFFRRRLVKMGVLTPTEEDKKAMEAAKAGAQEDPNSVYLKAAAEEAHAAATQSRVKTIDTLAAAELKRAQTAETLAGIDQSNREEVAKLAEKQRFDARAAQQDTIPAMINPGEARHLMQHGGAGKMNPVTGEMHFYQEEGSGNDGGNTGDGGNFGGGGGRQDPRNFGDTPGERQAWGDRNIDRATERAARFAPQGSVDPEAVAAGSAYGIDAGERKHTLDQFLQGFKFGPGGFITKAMAGGIRAAIGSAGSPVVNGGGWGDLGSSGQEPSSITRDPGAVVANDPNRGSIYQPRIPVEQWMNLQPDQRQAVMGRFWQQF